MARKHVPDTMVVAAALYRRATRGTDLVETLARWTGQPGKVCLRAAERADERGYIDYGTCIQWAWPTPEGMAMFHAAAVPDDQRWMLKLVEWSKATLIAVEDRQRRDAMARWQQRFRLPR